MRRTLAALVLALAAFARAAHADGAQPESTEPAPPPPPAATSPASGPQVDPALTQMDGALVHVDGPVHVDSNTAIVYIADDGGLQLQAVRAMRGLAIGQLRKRGVQVVDDVRAEGMLTRENAQRLMRDLHAGRGFAVEVQGRLGNKVPLELAEYASDRTVPIFSAGLTASSLEECDVVIPRLVNAVLDRRPAEENAEMASVTQKEARPFNKRPGEMHWSLGLVIPTFSGGDSSGSPFGLSTQLFYEIEHFNIGVEALFGSYRGLTAGGLFFQGNWLPIDGEVSPYVGLGLGYMAADSNGGLGLKAQVGVEALRLHQIRVLAGFEVLVPFFSTSSNAFGDGNSGNSDRHVLPMFFLQFSL